MTATILGLGALAPLLIVDRRANTQADTISMALAIGLPVFAALQLAIILWRGRGEDFMKAMFWVFIYVFAGLATVVQIGLDEYPIDNQSYPTNLVGEGVVHLWVGVLAFLAGSWCYRVCESRPGNLSSYREPRFRCIFSQRAAIICGVVGMVFVGWRLREYGIGAFFVSREQTTALLSGQGLQAVGPFYAETDKTTGLLWIFATQMLVFVSLFVLLYGRRYGFFVNRHQWVIDFYVVLPLIGANILVNNPIGNGRWWFVLVIVAFASIYFPYDRRGVIRLYTAGAAFLLLFAFASLDAFRFTAPSPSISHPTGAGETLATDPSYPVFQMHLKGLQYVHLAGHTHGRQLLGSVFGFLPHSVWPDKPGPTGQLIDPEYLRSASVWTEGYVDFGLAGIVALFFLIGLVIAWISDTSRRARPGLLHALFPLLAVLQLFVLRGSLQPALGTVYQLMFAFALVSRRVSRPPRTGLSEERCKSDASVSPPSGDDEMEHDRRQLRSLAL